MGKRIKKEKQPKPHECRAGITCKETEEEPKLRYAKDCKCCKCGEQAVCFWPIVDPDIQELPYCRKCVDKSKMDLMIKLSDLKK